MARLSPTPYPAPIFQTGSYDEYSKKSNACYEELKAKQASLAEGEIVGAMIDFPVADGRAMYYVKSERPLVLQHIPLWDAYQVHPAMIRGLTVADVRSMVQRNRRFTEIFAAKTV